MLGWRQGLCYITNTDTDIVDDRKSSPYILKVEGIVTMFVVTVSEEAIEIIIKMAHSLWHLLFHLSA